MPRDDRLAATIQDSDLLNNTQIVQGKGNLIQLTYQLPSGEVVSSSFFDAGKKKEVIQQWLDALRARIVADLEETRVRKIREGMGPIPDEADEPTLVQPVTRQPKKEAAPAPVVPTPAKRGRKPKATPAVAPSPSRMETVSVDTTDPVYFINQMIGGLKDKQQAIQAQIEKWEAVLDSLN